MRVTNLKDGCLKDSETSLQAGREIDPPCTEAGFGWTTYLKSWEKSISGRQELISGGTRDSDTGQEGPSSCPGPIPGFIEVSLISYAMKLVYILYICQTQQSYNPALKLQNNPAPVKNCG